MSNGFGDEDFGGMPGMGTEGMMRIVMSGMGSGGLAGMLGGRGGILDQETVDSIKDNRDAIIEFGEKLSRSKRDMNDITNAMNATFDDTEFVLQELPGGPSSRFLPTIRNIAVKPMSSTLEGYQALARSYELGVRGRLQSIDEAIQHDDHEILGAVAKANGLMHDANALDLKAMALMPESTKAIAKLFSGYNDYLRKRFIKDEETDNPMDIMIVDENGPV